MEREELKTNTQQRKKEEEVQPRPKTTATETNKSSLIFLYLITQIFAHLTVFPLPPFSSPPTHQKHLRRAIILATSASFTCLLASNLRRLSSILPSM